MLLRLRRLAAFISAIALTACLYFLTFDSEPLVQKEDKPSSEPQELNSENTQVESYRAPQKKENGIAIVENPENAKANPNFGGTVFPIRILQIGDSHTVADFFTGELRKSLQEKFGDGGPGYFEPVKPSLAYRNSTVTISATSGWSYSTLQKPNENSRFSLSGVNASASKADETLSYAFNQKPMINLIEIEFLSNEKGGEVEIIINQQLRLNQVLKRGANEIFVLQVHLPKPKIITNLEIKTLTDAPINILGIRVENQQSGVTLSRVGFPGSTVDILRRYNSELFRDELLRLNPSILILAFGTNEGFNDNLEIKSYQNRYAEIIKAIKKVLPNTIIVIIAPPHAARIKSKSKDTAQSCINEIPPNLDRVRQALLTLAQSEKVLVWDWSTLMSGQCPAREWTLSNPKLMTDDQVHMTKVGYEMSAKAFLTFILPAIGTMSQKNVVSND